MPTAVLDSADWQLAQPLQPAPGTTLDFAGTRVRIAFAETVGGPPAASADTADGTLVFVPASGSALPYFAITLPVAARSWRVSAPKRVFGDLLREPDPQDPAQVEWLGRIELEIHPGSGSSGIASRGIRPVLLPVQPYGGALALGAMQVGAQGPSGAPRSQGVSAGPVLAIDVSLGAYARVALSGSAPLALTGWPTDGEMGRVTLELDIAPGAAITAWPPGVLWANRSAPVLSPGPAKDVLIFTSVDGGATIFGSVVGQDYGPAV